VNHSVRITLACLDLAATAVADQGAVETAYTEAIATVGIVPGTVAGTRALARLRESRGLPQRDLFRALSPAGDEAWAATAELAFERAYGSVLDRLGRIAEPGTEAALDKLSGAGIRICLLTGFSNRILSRILDTLGWWNRADLAISPDDVGGRGSPRPDMILTAALKLGVDDIREVAVAAASAPILQTARHSGASMAIALGLRSPEATHTLDSLADLPTLLLGTSPAVAGRL